MKNLKYMLDRLDDLPKREPIREWLEPYYDECWPWNYYYPTKIVKAVQCFLRGNIGHPWNQIYGRCLRKFNTHRDLVRVLVKKFITEDNYWIDMDGCLQRTIFHVPKLSSDEEWEPIEGTLAYYIGLPMSPRMVSAVVKWLGINALLDIWDSAEPDLRPRAVHKTIGKMSIKQGNLLKQRVWNAEIWLMQKYRTV